MRKNIYNFFIGFGIVFVIGVLLFSLFLIKLPGNDNKTFQQETTEGIGKSSEEKGKSSEGKGRSSEGKGRSSEGKGRIRELTLEIKGLVCQACSDIVKTSLGGTPGVINATIELESGNAILNYNDFVISKDEILNHDIFSGYYTAKFVNERIIGEASDFKFESSPVLDYDYRYALEPLQSAEAKILIAIRSREGMDKIISLLDEVESRGKEIQEGTKENNEKRIRLMLRLSSLIENLGTSYTPGTYIYPAKIKSEQVRFSLSPTVIYKAKNQFLMANNRIKEMNFLLNLDKIEENKEKLSDAYSASIENTLKFVKVAKEKGKEKKQLLKFSDLVLKEVNENLPQHIEVLDKIYDKDIPEDIKVSLEELQSMAPGGIVLVNAAGGN